MNEFDTYFEKIYADRWSAIKAALKVKERQILRKNFFSRSVQDYGLQNFFCEQIHPFSKCYSLTDDFTKKQKEIPRDENHILDYYIMDPASFLAIDHFPISAEDKVLDMCAAPGGKSLILAEKIYQQGELFANELSEPRRERLMKVIQNYIPRENRDHIWVKGWDAQFFGLKMPQSFDKVLLDAPCSGERHQLESDSELKDWSVKKSERLAIRQYSLLASAFQAVKPEGLIMYSTCSINPMENDQIIAKLIKKKKKVKVEKIEWKYSRFSPEQTEMGYIFLPDRHQFGPIYFSLVRAIP